jgi:uncharacterized cupredoxin-like copper-binding protein
MRRRHRKLIAWMIAAVLLATACTSGGTAPTAAPAKPSASASTVGGSIAVQLIEGKITPDPTTARAGLVTFAIKNIGIHVHEFVIIKTDLKDYALPVTGDSVDESGLTVVGQVKNIALRATPTLDVELVPGHYVLICNIPDHYGAGMHTAFDVN